MKQMFVGLLLLVIVGLSAAAHAGEEQKAMVCTGKTPVKLFVGFVYIEQNDARSNYGNAIMCWEKEIESEDDLKRLHAAFKPRHKGDGTTILGITTLRK